MFQKSPLKNQAVHDATIYDINPPINTQYGAKSRHSRENGNLEALAPIGFEFMKHPLETRRYELIRRRDQSEVVIRADTPQRVLTSASAE